MKKLWDPIVESAEDLQKTAVSMLDDGVKFFRGHLGNIPLLSSSTAVVSEAKQERDETHYFLVPNPSEQMRYSLYSTRVLPQGIGPENNLPKARIFQLPAEGSEERLVELLLSSMKEKELSQLDQNSPLAERLDIVATEIDKQCNLVSGGLLLVGGAIAIANPLLGVGIAAKALLPGIGSKLSTHGIRHASDWLRSKSQNSAEEKSEATAKKQVKKLKPEVRVNRALETLETSLATFDDSFDPVLASQNMIELSEFPNNKLGANAILAVYGKNEKAGIDQKSVAWIHSLETIFTEPKS